MPSAIITTVSDMPPNLGWKYMKTAIATEMAQSRASMTWHRDLVRIRPTLKGKATAIMRCIAMKTTCVIDDVTGNTVAAKNGLFAFLKNSQSSIATKKVAPPNNVMNEASRSAMFRLTRARPKTEFFWFSSRHVKISWAMFMKTPIDPVAVKRHAATIEPPKVWMQYSISHTRLGSLRGIFRTLSSWSYERAYYSVAFPFL